MILDTFPRVLWINLDRSADRRDRMYRLLSAYGISHIRIRAIDGDKPMSALEEYCYPNPAMTKHETACTLSHLTAIAYFLTLPDPYVMIFEDDVSFEFLPHVPYDWSVLMSSLPPDWQVVQLAVSEVIPQTGIDLVRSKHGDGRYCSTAYLINKAGAQSIIDQYYSNVHRKYVLKTKFRPTSDEIICHAAICYSIPIFTYLTDTSTIHASHLEFHTSSKNWQKALWRSLGASQISDDVIRCPNGIS